MCITDAMLVLNVLKVFMLLKQNLKVEIRENSILI
jgi:hypothetical protein